ncbi:MAG: protein kinase [Firmicutes bacterium]|nr:protein kinase [Bacillota bacterium]
MLQAGYTLSNRYEVVKPLGQGGQSNVYLLKDTRLKGKMWVAKEMSVQYSDPRAQSLAQKHFEQEANMLATLEHVNLPKVIDYFSQSGKYYLIMEYLEGEDLGVLLKKAGRPFGEEQVARWAIQIATVLYYLHMQPSPIIFRDIKPSNIMICQGQVKLIDFGIARHFNPAKKGDTLRIGSPGFSPPEQYSGQTDPRSDIYSMGVAMHQLLTLFDPAKSQTPFTLPPIKVFNPEVSPKMIHIVETCLQIDPAKRFQTAIELKRALKEIIGAGMTQIAATGAITVPQLPGATVPAVPPQQLSQTVPAQPPVQGMTIPATPPVQGMTVPSAPPQGMTVPAAPPPQPQQTIPSSSHPQALKIKPPEPQPVQPKPAAQTPPAKSASKPSSSGSSSSSSGNGSARSVFAVIVLLCIAAGCYFAFTNFDRIKTLIPVSTPSAEPTPDSSGSLSRGVSYLEAGNYRLAIDELLAASKDKPNDPEIFLYLNRAYAGSSGNKKMTAGIILPFAGENKISAAKNQDFLSGAALAQRQINFDGGIKETDVEFRICRLTGSKEKDESLIKMLIDAKPVFIIAPGYCDTNAFTAEQSQQAGIAFLTPQWGLLSADKQGAKAIVLGIPAEKQIDAVIRTLETNQAKEVSIVYDAENYDSLRKLLEQKMASKKITLVDSLPYQPDKLDFDNSVTSVGAASPDGVVILGKEEAAAGFVARLRKKGAGVRVFLPPFLTDESFLALCGEKTNDIIGTGYLGRSFNYKAQYFMELFENAFGRPASRESAAGYDLLNLAAEAGRQTFAEPDKILAALQNQSLEPAFYGVSGVFGKKNDNQVFQWAVFESSEGKWKESGGFQQ